MPNLQEMKITILLFFVQVFLVQYLCGVFKTARAIKPKINLLKQSNYDAHLQWINCYASSGKS